MNTVLVTGNLGYIGVVLSEVLLERGYDVVGLDTGYYSGCGLSSFREVNRQITKDIRDVTPADLVGIDAIVHLAALSNDPLGELRPGLTEEINLFGTINLAKHARSLGIPRFVYASSQSMYGVAATEAELEEDGSEKNPLTVYARTKWDAELALKKLGSDAFDVVCLRPSTVFGASPMLRCDIVFNNLVACAYTTGRIEIKSDGTPWRPVVHVRDVASAFIAGLEAPSELVAGESFNVGIPDGNFTVRDLAEAAQRVVPGSTLTFTGEHGNDSRTYRISFGKILSVLAGYYRPNWTLDTGGAELVALFDRVGFTEAQFRGFPVNRLQQVRRLLDASQLNSELRWTDAKE